MPESAQASRSLALVDDLLAPEDEWRSVAKGGGSSNNDDDDKRDAAGSEVRGAGASGESSGRRGAESRPPKPPGRPRNTLEASTNILLGGLVILLGGALGWADLTSGPTQGILRELAVVAALLLVSHGVLMLITATEEKKNDSAARERTGLLLLALGLLLALSTLGHDPAAPLTILSYVAAFVLFGLGYVLLVRRPVAR